MPTDQPAAEERAWLLCPRKNFHKNVKVYDATCFECHRLARELRAAAQAAREEGITEGRRLEAEEVQGWVKDDMRDARDQAFDQAAKAMCVYCRAGMRLATTVSDTRGICHEGQWRGKPEAPVCQAAAILALKREGS